VTMLATYGLLRLQGHLPWHQYVDALSNKTPIAEHLAFNTAATPRGLNCWKAKLSEACGCR